MTAEELEMFIDGILEMPCNGDSCPIDFGGKDDEQNDL